MILDWCLCFSPALAYVLQMDIPGAMTDEECMEELELTDIRDKPWHIV